MAQRIAKMSFGGVSVWDVKFELKDGPVNLASPHKEWLGRIRLALEQSIESGELDRRTDVDEEARLFVAMVDGLGIQSLMSKEHLPRNATFVDRYLDRLYGT